MQNSNYLKITLIATAGLLGLFIAGCGQAAPQPVEATPASPQLSESAETVIEIETTSEIEETTAAGPVELEAEPIKQETRALWSWAGRKAKSKSDIDELVAKVDQANLNVILLGVYYKGTAYFEPSKTRFSNQEALTNQSHFKEDGYADALSYLLEIRDRRRADDDPFNDFEVHVWFTIKRGGDTDKNAEWPEPDTTQPYMLNAIFPEFKLKFGDYYRKNDDRYIDHATSVVHQPKFRDYMTNLIAGLVEDYNVDGVHLDHIRTGGICFNDEVLDYPGTKFDYPGCQADYRAFTLATYGREFSLLEDTDGYKGVKAEATERIAAWQEQAVGALVKSIHDEVKKARPDVVISVASVRNDTSGTSRQQIINGQAAWEWLDKGWIDAVFSTVYSADTQSTVDGISQFRQAVQNESYRDLVFPGLATSNVLDAAGEPRSYLLTEQVYAAMRDRWFGQPLEPPARGVALFSDQNFSEEAAEMLAKGPFKEPALPYWGQTKPDVERLPSP